MVSKCGLLKLVFTPTTLYYVLLYYVPNTALKYMSVSVLYLGMGNTQIRFTEFSNVLRLKRFYDNMRRVQYFQLL